MVFLNDNLWEVTRQHLGENGENVAIELQDPNGYFDANVRRDGMIELHLYHNVPKGETNARGDGYRDTLHLADLEDFIVRLQELKQFAQEFFDGQHVWQDQQEDQQDEI
ncbi:hypothetical protein EV586_10487 [Tumebacillus sp. BK434]|uniref:hypothetical protein n=1 Tax=Tumebacillus sp. BK434 TaxID=2512169 RepID=UPI00104EAFCB|nr:hypothetical protein [Tumebacillus sp. BK434]TCP54469.1 hypothetical protein EV586_10487 [Tumebacillus sp. BK434]